MSNAFAAARSTRIWCSVLMLMYIAQATGPLYGQTGAMAAEAEELVASAALATCVAESTDLCSLFGAGPLLSVKSVPADTIGAFVVWRASTVPQIGGVFQFVIDSGAIVKLGGFANPNVAFVWNYFNSRKQKESLLALARSVARLAAPWSDSVLFPTTCVPRCQFVDADNISRDVIEWPRDTIAVVGGRTIVRITSLHRLGSWHVWFSWRAITWSFVVGPGDNLMAWYSREYAESFLSVQR